MAKDPAFMLYSQDFLVGVSDLTMEERGQYITMLCLQHQKGRLSKKNILIGVGNVSDDVMSKFTKDENDMYYNETLEGIVQKREAYSQSRSENGKKGGRPKTTKKPKENHMETICLPYAKAYENHTENENENINVNIDKDVISNITVKNIAFNNEFDEIWKLYPNKQGREKARTSYIKARKEGIGREIIENGVNRYVQYCKDKFIDKQYIKHGSTWFNQRSWNDDYTIETKVETPKYSNTNADDALERALARAYETSSN